MTVLSSTGIQDAATGLAWAVGRLAADRDARAWAALLELAGPDILRLALRLTGDSALAEDAVQEALLLVRDHAARFCARSDDADGDARRWILGVTANASLQLLRRHQRQGSRDRRAGAELALAAEPAADPAERVERGDESRLLRRELAALPAPYGQALTLHYLAGQDYSALALHLQVPVNTARTRVNRGLKALRERLQRCGLALTVAMLGGALGDLGAATAAAALPASAPDLLTSATTPTTTFAVAATAIPGVLMTTMLATALAAGVAAAIIPWSSAQEPSPPAAPAVQPVPVRPLAPAVVPLRAPVVEPTAAMLETRVTFEFADTPSTEAWRFLAAVTGVPIRVDDNVAGSVVTLKVRDMRMRDVLNWLSVLGDVAWIDGGDHVRIGTKAAIAAAAPVKGVATPVAGVAGVAVLAPGRFSALDQMISADFQDTSLVDVASFLQRVTNVTIVIDPKVIAAGPRSITLRLNEMQVGMALQFITKLNGLTWVQKNDAVFITMDQGQAVPPAPPEPATKGATNF